MARASIGRATSPSVVTLVICGKVTIVHRYGRGRAVARPMHVPDVMRTRLIRQRLMRQRRQLLLRYRNELELADETLQMREAEEVERATEQWDATVIARLGEADARVLGDVVAAVRRLDAGTYGSCLTCGEDIAEQRLDVLPTATLCIDCANEARPAQRLPVREAHQMRRGM